MRSVPSCQSPLDSSHSPSGQLTGRNPSPCPTPLALENEQSAGMKRRRWGTTGGVGLEGGHVQTFVARPRRWSAGRSAVSGAHCGLEIQNQQVCAGPGRAAWLACCRGLRLRSESRFPFPTERRKIALNLFDFAK